MWEGGWEGDEDERRGGAMTGRGRTRGGAMTGRGGARGGQGKKTRRGGAMK